MKAVCLALFAIAALLVLNVGPLSAQETHGFSASPVSRVNGQGPNAEGTPDQPELKKRYPRYHLRSGDVLEISFTLTPEFNQSVTIQPDGYITLREIGDVYVQGQTLPELTETVRTAYAKILRDPIVAIVPKDLEGPYIIVGGWVKSPGKYSLRGDTSVAEAVAMAGGFTEASRHSEVYVYRRVDGNWVEIGKLNMKKMLAKADLSEDIHLHPGDLLYVPQNTLSKIKDFVVPRLGIGTRVP